MQPADHIIASIYRSTDPGTGWYPAAAAISAALGASTGGIRLGDALNVMPVRVLAAHGWTMEASILYGAHYHAVDPFNPIGRAGAPNTTLLTSQFIADRDLERTEYWNDFASRHGNGFKLIGANLGLVGDDVAMIGFGRRKGAGDFTQAEQLLCDALLPHMRNALGLWNRLRAAQSDTSQAMLMRDALGACLICDGEGRLSLVSPVAEALAGLAGLRLEAGQLAFNDPSRQAAMLLLLGRTAAGGAGGTRILAPDAPGGAIIAHVSRLPQHGTPDAKPPHPLLLELRRVQPQMPSAASLRAMFGLGAAEAEVALLLAEGMEVEAVAARRGTSVATVRTQIRAVLAKTATKGLRELSTLLLAMGRPGRG